MISSPGLTAREAQIAQMIAAGMSIKDTARRLSLEAEAVCRHYTSNGHREGKYWLVGDVHNTPGRSLFVGLSDPEGGKGAAGKWLDYVAVLIMLRCC